MKKGKLLAQVLHRAGGTRALDVFWGAQRITVLAYHRIIDWKQSNFKDYVPVVSATPQMFEQQMAFIAKRFNVIDLQTLEGFIYERKLLPARPLLITFDDGYMDNYDIAYPVLKKYGFPAVIFIVTSRMDTPTRLWWDECAYCFNTTKKSSTKLPIIGEQQFADSAARTQVREKLMVQLKLVPETEKLAAMDELHRVLDVQPSNDKIFMSWDHVRELAANRIACQPHTLTHPIMTRIPFEEQKRQLAEARARIEAETHQRAIAFAFPNGTPTDFSAETLRALRETSYTMAFTLLAGPMPAREARQYPLQIKRVYLGYQDSFEVFALKVMGLPAFMERGGYLEG